MVIHTPLLLDKSRADSNRQSKETTLSSLLMLHAMSVRIESFRDAASGFLNTFIRIIFMLLPVAWEGLFLFLINNRLTFWF